VTVDELIAREQMRHRIAAYNHAGDTDDAAAFADCFIEDAIFEGPGFRIDGREAIRTWKASQTIFGAASSRIHHVSGLFITLTAPDHAIVHSNWLVTTDTGPHSAGRYKDDLVANDGIWRIARRTGTVQWRADENFLKEA